MRTPRQVLQKTTVSTSQGCQRPEESYDDEYDDGVYYLCNPYTKQWVQLPPAPSKGQAVLGMICDHPIVCNDDDDVPKGLGGVGLKPRHFGSEALFRDQLAHHRFRVVRVPLPVFANDDGEGGFQVDMLSCGGGDSGGWEWTVLGVLPPPRPRPFIWKEHRIWVRRHGVACNGLLHWLLGSSGQLLLAYDPYTNVVRATVETPQEAAPIFPLKLLGASCGSIWATQYVPHFYPSYDWFIWQLSPDYDGWILRRRFKEVFVRGFFEMRSRSMALLDLLAIHPNNPNTLYVLWSKHTPGQGFENAVGRLDLAAMESKLLVGRSNKTSSLYSWRQTCVLPPPPS
ncbi:unnamed protein product [Cuscuta campestris]|uniref:Uncharacterized protein n=1 Tax=Cuscuta campestris TaxID=132261 RepID=A0A484KUH1_9ASTE|nr:unnamed protein product [Cuscuta campestris]